MAPADEELEGVDEPLVGTWEGLDVLDEEPPELPPLPAAAVAVFDGLAVAIAPTPPVKTVPVGSCEESNIKMRNLTIHCL